MGGAVGMVGGGEVGAELEAAVAVAVGGGFIGRVGDEE